MIIEPEIDEETEARADLIRKYGDESGGLRDIEYGENA